METIYHKNDSPITFRISNNQILRIINKKNDQLYVPIPLGLNLDSYDRLYEKDDYVVLISTEKNESDFFKEIKLSKNPKPEKYQDGFEISLIFDILEYKKALCVLHKEHYILTLPTGLPILLKKNGEIYGVVYFSKMTYGNPAGRINYFKETMKMETEADICRFANNHIGCIDRIVIDSNFKNKGVGNFFVKILGDFLQYIYINNNLKGIEVMTSWTLDEFIKKRKVTDTTIDLNKVVLNEDHDFFCNAGYLRVSQQNPFSKHTKPDRIDKGHLDKMYRKHLNEEGVITNRSENVVRYYYIKVL